jgi:hypothetical protein
MSDEYLTPAEQAMASLADLEDVMQDLLACLTDAATLVEHLTGALAYAGLHDVTHPEVFELVHLLRGMLAEHAVEDKCKPTLRDIADWVRRRGDVSEE